MANRENNLTEELADKFVAQAMDLNVAFEFENVLEHVLIPLSNNRFDSVNCLNKLGITKPSSFDQYYKYMEDIRNVTMLNNEIEKIETLYSHENLISIMN